MMIGGRGHSMRAANTGLGHLLPRRRPQSTPPVLSESGTQSEDTSVVTREASGEPGGTSPDEEKQPASSRAESVVGATRAAKEGVEALGETISGHNGNIDKPIEEGMPRDTT